MCNLIGKSIIRKNDHRMTSDQALIFGRRSGPVMIIDKISSWPDKLPGTSLVDDEWLEIQICRPCMHSSLQNDCLVDRKCT